MRKNRQIILVLPIAALLLCPVSVRAFVSGVDTGTQDYWSSYLPSRAAFNSGQDSPEVNTGTVDYWRGGILPASGAYQIIGVGPEITGLAAKTADGGAEILEGVWQSDDDPYFGWDESSSPTGIAEYKYNINDSTIDDSNGTSTGTNTYVQLAADTLSNSQHTVYFKAKNNSGTWGEVTSFEIWVDDAVPDIVGVTGWTDVSKTESLTTDQWQNDEDDPYLEWTDPNSLSGDIYYYTTDDSEPEGNDLNVAVVSLSLGSQGEGSTTIKVRPQSGADVWGDARSFILKYDITAPPEASNLQGDQVASSWSTESAVTFTWTDAVDDPAYSGLNGYVTGINTSSDDWTGTTKDVEEGVQTKTVYFPDGASNYFHIRAVDNAGNLDATSADSGPYWIDTEGPDVQTIYCYTDSVNWTTITESTWQTDSSPYFTWEEPSSAAPVTGYYYTVDSDPWTWTTQTDLDYSGNPFADGQYTFKVMARDEAGNEGDIKTFALYIGENVSPGLNLTIFLHGYLNETTFAQQTATVNVQFRTVRNSDIGEDYDMALDENGNSGEELLTGLTADSYYLLVRHKLSGETYSGDPIPLGSNHFPVISRDAVTFSEGTTTNVNFSDQSSSDFTEVYVSTHPQASSPMIAVGTDGRFRQLGGGDADANQTINVSDILKWDTSVGFNNSDDRGEEKFSDQGNFNGNDQIEGYDFNIWKKMINEGNTYAPLP